MIESLRASWLSVREKTSSWDWSMVILVAGCLLSISARVVVAVPLSWASKILENGNFAAYEHSLADAAIKKPGDARPLLTIDAGATKVQVTTFSFPSLKKGSQKTNGETWVSLPDELKKACVVASDPKLALQQVLGLPPVTSARVVYEILVKREDLFRPCLGGSNLDATKCSFTFPDALPLVPEPGDTATSAEKDAANTAIRQAYKPLREDYDRLWFLTRQMWNSYQTGFPNPTAGSADFPNTGFPFTGMGWTYNWNPHSETHAGVSEFVLRSKADIEVLQEFKPEDFCSKK